MTQYEVAVQQDVAGQITDAAQSYEEVLQGKTVQLSAYLNLAVLYWESTEYGFNCVHQLPLPFIHQAAERYEAVLREAEARFGRNPEIKF